MFSVIFPGQGSQSVGMANELYNKFEIFKINFKKADDLLNYKLSKIILEGPSDKLNLTENQKRTCFVISSRCVRFPYSTLLTIILWFY